MASLTVRQLDDRLKRLLRLRAARSGRSVEDEVRTILRSAAEETGLEAHDLIEPRPLARADLVDHRRRHRRI
jgi:phosphopantothenoylcysteine decarboxylase/phosphopantothenate--cysteine ligase